MLDFYLSFKKNITVSAAHVVVFVEPGCCMASRQCSVKIGLLVVCGDMGLEMRASRSCKHRLLFTCPSNRLLLRLPAHYQYSCLIQVHAYQPGQVPRPGLNSPQKAHAQSCSAALDSCDRYEFRLLGSSLSIKPLGSKP